jgi:prepilin-type N-terminal cleavage/methylation domain-containing protein
MRLRQIRGRVRRPGFTLIELLVVMAIIVVLVGLLMSAVISVLAARSRAQTRTELAKLESALSAGMQEHYAGRPKTLPGKLVLYNNLDVYRNPGAAGVTATSNPNLKDVSNSAEALRKMFGTKLIRPGGVVNWDGAGNTNAMILEGQHCLVFYIGGMPAVSGGLVRMTGFSTNPENPTEPGGERIKPFYEFESTRLRSAGAPAGFYSYHDPYGTPYVYFGGTGAANSYVSHTSLGVSAYVDSTGKYAKPNSFQILSAGPDRRFGAGGVWDPRSGSTDQNARDDMSNFSTAVLTAPQD